MTATPIPRSLALAFYGDLDISRLKELPQGRKPITTRLVAPDKRVQAYEFIRKQIAKGRQAYVVTPLIEESDKLGVKSATKEAEKLQKEIFPKFTIRLLHGRLKGEEKKKIMDDFKSGKTDILVSTTVIEVGVDAPNATIMMIENAERFGLATLHQLRGRVGRSEHQSYCLLFAEIMNEVTQERLMAVVKSTDGFALAEKDLELRGPGEVLGQKQSGFVPFKIAELTDTKLIKQAKAEADKLLGADPGLKTYPALREKVGKMAKSIHLE
jgi:ATP-dependent DNA helicase RecG